MTRQLKIGDVEPVPPGSDLDRARAIQKVRGSILRAARSNSRRAHAVQARYILSETTATQFRLTDPMERAKTFLRRRGYTPVCRLDGRTFMVGSRQFARDQEVMDFARSKGWGG